MELQRTICYQALLAHDSRFDGVFFTCVTSTGIYCRPVCPTYPPKLQNCRFVGSSIEAEKAGFRPCLRCRPELAPRIPDQQAVLPAHKLAAYIDETLLMDKTLGSVAYEFGLSERQLRRIFEQTFGVEPKRYLTSRRLLFAKQLLQDTHLPVTDIAFSAGFNGRGRLTINMQRAYGLTPERLRKESPDTGKPQQLVLRTDYRPPFDWIALLRFLHGRATPLEWVAGNSYHRIVDGHEIVVKNVPAKSHLSIHVPLELSRQVHAILQKVRHLFDLDASPTAIADTLSRDASLAPLLKKYPGLRVPGSWNNFEMLLRVVVGQQISVAGATAIMRRLAERIGMTPEAITQSSPDIIAAIGMPRKRAATVWQLGKLVQSGTLNLGEKDPKVFYDQIIAIPGIGPWTAEYLRMRILHWPDAFPAGDLGLQKAITPGQRQTERQLVARSADWRPWRSYATMLLWKSLENKGG